MRLTVRKWGRNARPTKYNGNKHSKRLSAPTGASAVAGSLTTETGVGEYHTRISVEEVVGAGSEDGGFGVLNREIVGENAHPHFLESLTARHGTARNVIGHIFRGDYQAMVATLSLLLPKIKVSKERALSAIDTHASALKHQLLLQAAFVEAGCPLVKKDNRRLLALTYLVLFTGDWALIAVGFQLFGLSDKPWIPGIGFTDDLHLAAVSSVAALVLLGHFAATPLRQTEHALRLRHNVAEEDREGLPRPAPFDGVWLLVLLGSAGCTLYALSNIRATYLASQGIPANGAAFLLLQAGIFAASLALGLAHQPDPDAEEWRGKLSAASVEVTATGKVQVDALDTYSDEVGQYNGGVAYLGAVFAQAGHHVRTDRENTAVMASGYYLRSYLISQPGDQIAQENILADGYEYLPHYNGEQLRSWLAGVTPLPTFPLLSTRSVEQHLANRRGEVDRLRVRIDQTGIDALNLPDYEKPEDEPVDSDELSADAVPSEDDQPAFGGDTGLGASASSTSARLFPVQADENDIVPTEVLDPGGDEETA